MSLGSKDAIRNVIVACANDDIVLEVEVGVNRLDSRGSRVRRVYQYPGFFFALQQPETVTVVR